MKQSKEGNQWYFGMKAHIGVDAHSGLAHSVCGTMGSVNDVVEANTLLHGELTAAWACRVQGTDSALTKKPVCAGTLQCAQPIDASWTKPGSSTN